MTNFKTEQERIEKEIIEHCDDNIEGNFWIVRKDQLQKDKKIVEEAIKKIEENIKEGCFQGKTWRDSTISSYKLKLELFGE